MECKLVQEKLSFYVDGVIDEATMERIEAHLASCVECRNELELLRLLIETTADIEEIEPPVYLKADILEAARAKKKQNIWSPVRSRQLSWAAATMAAATAVAALFIPQQPVTRSYKHAPGSVKVVTKPGTAKSSVSLERKPVVKPVEKTREVESDIIKVVNRLVENNGSVAVDQPNDALYSDVRKGTVDIAKRADPLKTTHKAEIEQFRKQSIPEAEKMVIAADTTGETAAEEEIKAIEEQEKQVSDAHKDSSVMRIAVAAPNPARDLHEAVQTIKLEVDKKNQAQTGHVLLLFDKRF